MAAPKYRQEFRRVAWDAIDRVNSERGSNRSSSSYPKVYEVMDDVDWEVVGSTDSHLLFRRIKEVK